MEERSVESSAPQRAHEKMLSPALEANLAASSVPHTSGAMAPLRVLAASLEAFSEQPKGEPPPLMAQVATCSSVVLVPPRESLAEDHTRGELLRAFALALTGAPHWAQPLMLLTAPHWARLSFPKRADSSPTPWASTPQADDRD